MGRFEPRHLQVIHLARLQGRFVCAGSDCLILLSSEEGRAPVVIEAPGHGRLVIFPQWCGGDGLVHNAGKPRGFVIHNPDDDAELTGAMSPVLTEAKRARFKIDPSEVAAATAREIFVRQILKLLDEMHSRGK